MSTKSPTLLEEKALADGLDDVGCAVIRGLLFASECDDYRSRYATREHFRSHIIDRLEGRYLAAVGGFTTGSAVIAIIFTVGAQSQPGVYFAFALLGFGWGGLIPIQEVIWARFSAADTWGQCVVPRCRSRWRLAPVRPWQWPGITTGPALTPARWRWWPR